MAFTDKLTHIADAIREKTGKTDPMTLDQMPDEIAGIQSGGGEDKLAQRITDTLVSYTNATVKTLRPYCFAHSYLLESVDFPEVEDLAAEGNAGAQFDACKNLKNVNLPKCASVSSFAFRNCTSLESLSLPSLRTMTPATNQGGYFWGCKNLRAIDFPNLEEVRYEAFSGTEIEDFDLPKLTTITWRGFLRSKIKNAVFPAVTTVNTGGFEACTSLTKADFSAITSIGATAFQGCTSLQTVILRGNFICALANTSAFTNTPIAGGTGYIYVPRAFLESYRAETNWVTFASGFRAIEDYPEICGGAAE